MSKVVALIGAKGGTLKTASVAAIAHVLSRTGLRVVMVDLDPQGDLTSRSGFSRIADPLAGEVVPVQFEKEPSAPLSIVRSGRSLESANYAQAQSQIRRVQQMDIDLIVIDTPPALGPLTHAAAHAADYVIIPSEPGIESRDRCKDVLQVVEQGGRTPTIRIVVTKAKPGTIVYQWMVEEVDTHYPGLRSPIVIPHETAAVESAIWKLPTTVSAPRSNSALAYVRLAADIIGTLGVESRNLNGGGNGEA